MSKEKARQPDRAAKSPASSTNKVVKVNVLREFNAEITLAVPEDTTDADLVDILAKFESENDFDGVPWYVECEVGDDLKILACETIEVDQSKAVIVATRDEDGWDCQQMYGGGNH